MSARRGAPAARAALALPPRLLAGSLLAATAALAPAAASSEHGKPQIVLEAVSPTPGEPIAFGVRGLPKRLVDALRRPHAAGAAAPSVAAAGSSRTTTERLGRLFSVHAGSERAPALLGEYRLDGEGLWLVPAFPPDPGVTYVAVFRPRALSGLLADEPGSASEREALADLGDAPLRRSFAFPRDPASVPSAAVAAVHPGAAEVPANLLRLYLVFTAPMTRGHELRWIRLERHDGQPIAAAFLALDDGLWDRDATRLTLLLDPARIKSGLVPRAELGGALVPGDEVTLAIDGGWPDAHGRPLGSWWRRSFRVVAADHEPPDPARWMLRAPRASSREPLRVELGEPLDHALLHRLVWVEEVGGERVTGAIETAAADSRWIFTPDTPWRTDSYALVVDRWLEDLAGNRVGRPFEVELAAPQPDGDPGGEHSATTGGAAGSDAPVRLLFRPTP